MYLCETCARKLQMAGFRPNITDSPAAMQCEGCNAKLGNTIWATTYHPAKEITLGSEL